MGLVIRQLDVPFQTVPWYPLAENGYSRKLCSDGQQATNTNAVAYARLIIPKSLLQWSFLIIPI